MSENDSVTEIHRLPTNSQASTAEKPEVAKSIVENVFQSNALAESIVLDESPIAAKPVTDPQIEQSSFNTDLSMIEEADAANKF